MRFHWTESSGETPGTGSVTSCGQQKEERGQPHTEVLYGTRWVNDAIAGRSDGDADLERRVPVASMLSVSRQQREMQLEMWDLAEEEV